MYTLSIFSTQVCVECMKLKYVGWFWLFNMHLSSLSPSPSPSLDGNSRCMWAPILALYRHWPLPFLPSPSCVPSHSWWRSQRESLFPLPREPRESLPLCTCAVCSAIPRSISCAQLNVNVNVSTGTRRGIRAVHSAVSAVPGNARRALVSGYQINLRRLRISFMQSI